MKNSQKAFENKAVSFANSGAISMADQRSQAAAYLLIPLHRPWLCLSALILVLSVVTLWFSWQAVPSTLVAPPQLACQPFVARQLSQVRFSAQKRSIIEADRLDYCVSNGRFQAQNVRLVDMQPQQPLSYTFAHQMVSSATAQSESKRSLTVYQQLRQQRGKQAQTLVLAREFDYDISSALAIFKHPVQLQQGNWRLQAQRGWYNFAKAEGEFSTVDSQVNVTDTR